MKQILSLIQPNGDLHLGNYFGAVKNWVDLQEHYDCIYGLADYHVMTMPYDPAIMRMNTWKMAFQVMACGVKPDNLFIQSLIPEHAELCWILSNVCSFGELTRMTQFKDKSDQSKESSKDAMVSAGLLFYPVLMAADILIYRADYVPIGKDQDQHLELSRNISERFNTQFKTDYLVHPEPLYTELPKVLSLANPMKKMSKSLGEKHYINLFGDPAVITKQVRSAVTDAGDQPAGAMSPGVSNLFELLKASGKMDIYNDFKEKYQAGGMQYGPLKIAVAEVLVELTGSFREKLQQIMNQESLVKEQIYDSSATIRKKARETVDKVREITGFPVM